LRIEPVRRTRVDPATIRDALMERGDEHRRFLLIFLLIEWIEG
jgi:hypothetical protein